MPVLSDVYVSELRLWKRLVKDEGQIRKRHSLHENIHYRPLQSAVQVLYAGGY